MYDTILVPTDGSEGSEIAARHALTFEEATGGTVHFLRVAESPDETDLEPNVETAWGDERTRAERKTREALERFVDRVTDRPNTTQTAVTHGRPAEAIRSYATEQDIDLIAMGTHGRTGLSRVLIGSVTERVVRTSECPVLTCSLQESEDEHVEFDEILVPTDGSECATRAVKHALDVADTFGATIHAFSVVDVMALAEGYEAEPGFGVRYESQYNLAENAVATVSELAEGRDVDVNTEIREGAAYRAINAYSEESGVDLIAMGTHGRKGLQRYLIGSVTERVVRTSDVPVLTVR
jgi:nucleotide-binding universal stress UspA family protein